MCAIAGVFGEVEGSGRTAERMILAQGHRGPDAVAALEADHYLAAAHARLAILDTSKTGDQPFADSERLLVYNGEIYNHLALRAELEPLGAQFRGTSDTATLFEALRLLGVEQTVRRLRGMFAFAYYEIGARTLYLCRDRLGIKPLHYVRHSDALYFASEIKGLAAAVPVALDPIRMLFSIASVADDSLDRTAFSGVRQVPPGGIAVCRPGHPVELRRYYQPMDDFDEAYYRELERSPGEVIVRRFAAALERAVHATLAADVPVGAFVSGGIDSSLIAAHARREAGGLALFSSDVVGPDSEIEDARMLARWIDAPLHESRFEPEHFLGQWARATWHYEYPIVRHVNAIPFAAVAGLARARGIKAVLTGEGSDELFLGYPKLLSRRFDAVARLPIDALLALYGRLPGLREHLWPRAADQPDAFINLLAQDYQRQRLREEALPKLEFLGEQAAQEHYLTAQLLQESLHSLLHRNDRMGMSHGVEARFPFLDEELVRLGINLPVKFKVHWSRRFHNYKHPFLEDKWIVRAAARDLLPRPLVTKRKNGFPVAGYDAIRVAPSFFADGYVMDVLALSRATFDYVVDRVPRVFIARLAAVDMMGRLFQHGWSVERMAAHVRAHAWLVDRLPPSAVTAA